MWVGGVADSQKKVQTPQKKQITPKIAFSTQISPSVLPNLTKTLGWVDRFGRDLPKKHVFFWGGGCFTNSLFPQNIHQSKRNRIMT